MSGRTERVSLTGVAMIAPCVALWLFLGAAHPGFADDAAEGDTADNDVPVEEVRREAPQERTSFYAPRYEPERPRSDLLMPLFSLILPGLDQWWEGQPGSAAVYSGVALGSTVYVINVARANGLLKKPDAQKDEAAAGGDGGSDSEEQSDAGAGLGTKDLVQRKIMLGNQVYQVAGGFSAWHAFRTAAYTRQAQGQYEFLASDETPADVLLAPFRFSYLKRSTTYIPLAAGLGLAALIMRSPQEGYERDRFSAQDGLFTSAFSFNAGTHEEAVFRGWLMPVMMESWQSPLWANVGQSTLFALAHLGNTPVPIAQLLLGYHLGYVTQKDGWGLGEAAFIHTWWDVIAFATMWHFREKADDASAALLPVPVLWLPPFELRF